MRVFKQAIIFAAVLWGVSSQASATVLDLTTAGASGSFTVGTDFFIQIPDQSTGTGVIDPFVRLIDGGGTTAQGYNTDKRPTSFDENSSPQFTHSLLLSAVPEVTLDGLVYYQFMLDINQTGDNPKLSLNELQLFTAGTGDLSGNTLNANGVLTVAGMTLIYDMDTTDQANRVNLDFSLNSGSGSGDMFFYFRKPAGVDETQFLYLYSVFGPVEFPNNDGFEEWAILKTGGGTGEGQTPIPEPASLLLLGSGLGAVAHKIRKKRAEPKA